MDPELARLPVNGVFRADNTAALVRLMESGFGIKAEYEGDRILLRPAKK
jgi:ferric-dicitrate binding protein FerR (iron transport regulator)